MTRGEAACFTIFGPVEPQARIATGDMQSQVASTHVALEIVSDSESKHDSNRRVEAQMALKRDMFD
jgi:hypothetical protein